MRIYLSKSNAAPKDVVDDVRETLLRSYNGLYLKEYAGSAKYSLNVMDGANAIVVVPPTIVDPHGYDSWDDRFLIGRGQYEEIVYAIDNDIQVLFVTDYILNERLLVFNVDYANTFNINNWQEEYGEAIPFEDAVWDVSHFGDLSYCSPKDYSVVERYMRDHNMQPRCAPDSEQESQLQTELLAIKDEEFLLLKK